MGCFSPLCVFVCVCLVVYAWLCHTTFHRREREGERHLWEEVQARIHSRGMLVRTHHTITSSNPPPPFGQTWALLKLMITEACGHAVRTYSRRRNIDDRAGVRSSDVIPCLSSLSTPGTHGNVAVRSRALVLISELIENTEHVTYLCVPRSRQSQKFDRWFFNGNIKAIRNPRRKERENRYGNLGTDPPGCTRYRLHISGMERHKNKRLTSERHD